MHRQLVQTMTVKVYTSVSQERKTTEQHSFSSVTLDDVTSM